MPNRYIGNKQPGRKNKQKLKKKGRAKIREQFQLSLLFKEAEKGHLSHLNCVAYEL